MRTWILAGTLAGLASLAACNDGPSRSASAQSAAPQPMAAASGAAANGAATAERGTQVLYVDVRTPQEYAAGHVEGAVNIPYDQMEQRWQEVSSDAGDRDIVVYCHSGRRAGIAKNVLERHGVEAENAGGLSDLQAEGLPVVQ